MNILLAWLGNTDVNEIGDVNPERRGPIEQAVRKKSFDQLLLLSDQKKKVTDDYAKALSTLHAIEVKSAPAKLDNPTDYREIYAATTSAVDGHLASLAEEPYDLYFHITPGTPAMCATWILLANTRYKATLIQSSLQHGVKEADVPFEIAAEFMPTVLKAADQKLNESLDEIPKEGATFGDIKYKSAIMQATVRTAKKASTRNIPVVLEGESGTGKELFARAIHDASQRAARPFIAVNCGAIPKDLVEAELFGVAKGAFTGAVPKPGYFEAANNGTLFLDEIGDLPLDAQVKLLRALQQGEVIRVGEHKPIKVDVRIVAATHRNLLDAVQQGDFREDLLYRLLGLRLRIPPLREREGDIIFLAGKLLQQVNEESSGLEPNYINKTLSAGAKKLILQHNWPGNVRELLSTLRRAAIWADGNKIENSDMESALLPILSKSGSQETILNREIGNDFELEAVKEEVERHYVSRAMKEAGNKKNEAAKLLGIKNYQTLTKRLEKYGLD